MAYGHAGERGLPRIGAQAPFRCIKLCWWGGKACCGAKRWYLFVLLVPLAIIVAISAPIIVREFTKTNMRRPRHWQPRTRPPPGPAPIQYISSNTLAGIHIQRPSQTTPGAREQGYPLLLHPALVTGILVAFFVLISVVGVAWIRKWARRICKHPIVTLLPSRPGPPDQRPVEGANEAEKGRPEAPVRLAVDQAVGSMGAASFPVEDRSL